MLESDLALVTGASRGIGRAIALALGGAGATVVGTATTAEGAARLSADFRGRRHPGPRPGLDRDRAGFDRGADRCAGRGPRVCRRSWSTTPGSRAMH